ncbi:MAG: ATP-binding cassette domain-containing protein [Anaerococcus sp.]|nr:ATP-binding cassette domain-containing protein [Anaerococcus sp.]
MSPNDNISRIIEKRRIDNLKNQEERKKEIYEKFPRIRVIDKTIASLGQQGAKIAQGGMDVEEYKRKLKELDREKEEILVKNSYPKELSGGMAQRVSLIRTMISKPEIFLLDEPLGSLDAFTRMNMQDEILNLWQEIKNLMIMVTHDVEEAVYMSTKIIIMEPRPGRIKEVVDINLDYPRDRTSQKFIEYRNKILKILNY